jgi:hypothetical protein
MSAHANPNIVDDGLVLCLDASDRKSYSGNGTTWYDRSGNGNNGTLVNGVSWSSEKGGIMKLDGIDDYISIPISLNYSNVKYTVIAVARYSGSQNKRVISSNSGNWLLGWWSGKVDTYYAEGWVSSSNGSGYNAVDKYDWHIYAGTGDRGADSYQLFKNGTALFNAESSGANGPNGIRVGNSGGVANEISNCECQYVIAYNRVLTAAEVLQNFNATKSRFNL